jgi:hypothetical protein
MQTKSVQSSIANLSGMLSWRPFLMHKRAAVSRGNSLFVGLFQSLTLLLGALELSRTRPAPLVLKITGTQ